MDGIRKISYEVKDIDSKKGIITLYANTFDRMDTDNDVSLKGSFKKTIKEWFNRVKWFYNHDMTKLLGVPLEAKEDNFGLLLTGQLNLQKELSKDVFEDYKLYADNGRSLEHSIGVNAVKYETFEGDSVPKEFKKEANGWVRVVSEWKWWEFSTLSGWGANQESLMVSLKNLKEIDNTLSWLDKMKERNYTDERHKNIELTISTLKSLKNEPFESTPQEPDLTTNDKSIDAAKYLLNNLKCLKDG